MWEPQLAAFPEHRVLAADARGHGRSSDASAPYRLADDAVALLDALEIDRAVLIGISMGGGTAVDVALEHPGRAAALVVSGTGTSEPHFTEPWALQTFADWKAAESGGDLEAWVEVFMRFTAGPDRKGTDVDPGVWELVARMARETVLNHLRTDENGTPLPPVPPTPVTGTWERLADIGIPVLALPGAVDGVDHRGMGRELADAVPDGEYREIADSAHYPNLENPSAFHAAIEDFLALHGM
jgi:pimeloyl-ACP methyl ester carboxylesterase